MAGCPNQNDFLALLDSRLEPDHAAELELHVSNCDSCEERLEQLVAEENRGWDTWRDLLSKDTDGLREDPALISEGPQSKLIEFLNSRGYTEIEEIGRGGMGVVYRAHQASLQRDVAIKMLLAGSLAGPERMERLLVEARAIGQLKHPNIMQIYGVEQFERLPVLILEFVTGEALSDSLNEGPMAVQQATEIMLQVTAALAHAHQHKVLHRDVKPANVLVSDGVVRLADFGLAKLAQQTEELTGSRVLGTPSYMAPEQAQGASVGPTTDVYAAGVVLYEMLCGAPPFRSNSPAETIHLINTQDPVPPRRLQPAIDRDLETICLKCLEKNPGQRYADSQMLHEDLRRYHNKQPILARPAGLIMRVRKFYQRYPAVASLISVCAAACLLLLWMWWQFTQGLAAQTQLAEQRLTDEIASNEATEEILEFFTQDLFVAATPEREGIDLRVVDVLENAEATLDENFKERPRVEAAIRAAIGNTYHEIGLPASARRHLQRASEIYDELNEETLFDAQFDAQYGYATCLKSLHELDEAEELFLRLLSVAPDPRSLLRCRNSLLDIDLKRGKNEEAEPMLEALLDDCQQEFGPDDSLTLVILGQLAVVHFKKGDFEAAREVFQQQLDAELRVLGETNPDSLISMNNLAICYVRLGRLEDAENMHEQCLAIKREALGPQHYSTLGSQHNLAMVAWRLNKRDKAIALLAETIPPKAEAYGNADRRTLETLYQLGRMLIEEKRYSEGAELYRQYFQPVMEELPADGQVASWVLAYAQLEIGEGNRPEAEVLIALAEETLQDPEHGTNSRLKMLEQTKELLGASGQNP